MTSDSLETAAQALSEASDEASGEAATRLESQADQFASLATDPSGLDHGKLARHEHILTSIADAEGGAVADHVEEALASIKSYRSTLEGV
ncbi:DUF7553 family protein [Natronobiforma cellulositropha]|uniref:DUF7553 family protein n=1 Tax=Natronobiforma cellulositropha TaxID=1679076 RepID=UPI0021D56E38|nr:hypothetical protein [Natronobiforma cellulositropha]